MEIFRYSVKAIINVKKLLSSLINWEVIVIGRSEYRFNIHKNDSSYCLIRSFGTFKMLLDALSLLLETDIGNMHLIKKKHRYTF